jgi:hypothetical protein
VVAGQVRTGVKQKREQLGGDGKDVLEELDLTFGGLPCLDEEPCAGFGGGAA